MIRILKNTRGQVISAEYVLVFFLVIGMITAMSIYFRRTLQAKIRDARYGMVDIVKDRTGGMYAGTNVYRAYEPYYMNQVADVTIDDVVTDRITASGLSTGTFEQVYDINRTREIDSSTAAPKDAY